MEKDNERHSFIRLDYDYQALLRPVLHIYPSVEYWVCLFLQGFTTTSIR